jgi:hypothetical protein
VIITKELVLKWNNKHMKYYVEKGYKYTGSGTEFICKIEDVLPKCNQRIDVQCPVCGKIINVKYNDYTTVVRRNGEYRCYSCSRRDIINEHIDEIRSKISGANNVNWNNGITDIRHWLREKISEWVREQLRRTNYKCELSGDGGTLQVHHRFPFSKILEITLNETGLSGKTIGDLSEEERDILETNFIKNHDKLAQPIVLSIGLHRKFHSLYGYSNNTPEQFDEFEERYKKGDVVL